MNTLTPTELHANLDHLLDEILATGIPLEIKIGESRLRIVVVENLPAADQPTAVLPASQ